MWAKPLIDDAGVYQQGVVRVGEVIERNNCAGKKEFFVTAIEEDELIHSRFRLTRAWMQPRDKLILSSICPMDEVRVSLDYYPGDPFLAGEFTQIVTDIRSRDAICRCGTHMISDGFELYCPNDRCALTLVARLERLGNTSFSNADAWSVDPFSGEVRIGIIGENLNYTKPFLLLTKGMFWGDPGGSVEKVLLTRGSNHNEFSLATFLIESLFIEFLDSLNMGHAVDGPEYEGVGQFYADMAELTQRRNYDSDQQNSLMTAFLWSLGIESLTPYHIHAMLHYETAMKNVCEPMLAHAFLLTHPDEMIKELSFHHLEAAAIVGEVRRRKFELYDIFHEYTQNKADISECFKQLL